MPDHNDLIGSDHPLTAAQRRTLAVVLNMIVPPSADGRLPGAAEIDVLAALQQTASQYLPTLRAQLDRLDAAAQALSQSGFADLVEGARAQLLDRLRTAEPDFLRDLALQTVTCYYDDDRVLRALGMDPRPPYPQGYEVRSGDLSLLDPVRQRGRKWRDPAG